MAQDLLNRPEMSNLLLFPIAKDLPELLRVATYNIRIDHREDRGGPHDWKIRQTMVASLIAQSAFDLVGIQEANASQWDDLKRLLPAYVVEGFPAGMGLPQEENLLVAYRKDRLELLEASVFSLSPNPNQPARGWDARYHRAFVYSRLYDKKSDKRIVFFNTHFDHKGEVARAESTKLLVSLQDHLAQGAPRVLVGDFNLYPDRGGLDLYGTLVNEKSGLKDVRDVAKNGNFGPDGTWLGWEYEASRSPDGQVGHRLDHIFVGGALGVQRCGVFLASIDPNNLLIAEFDELKNGWRCYPSDHLPVVADLLL